MRRLLRRGNDQPDFAEVLHGYQPPSFPAVISEALQVLGDPETDMAAVAGVVQRDPQATTRILQVANSASSGLRSPAESVHQAATLLGRNQLEALLISVGAKSALPQPSADQFDNSRFWSTASKRAILASMIAELIDPSRRSDNFTAALLQDMAVPVLASRADNYNEVLQEWHQGGDLARLETNSFGWHHGQVASWIGERWELPEHYLSFMADHHDTGAVEHLVPAQLVAHIREADTEGDDATIQAGSDAGLDSDHVRAMIEAAEEQTRGLTASLG